MVSQNGISRLAQELLDATRSRVEYPANAEKLWSCLTAQDRERLGGDLRAAYLQNGGTAGMWMRLRGVSEPRAVLEVAKKIGSLLPGDYDWLLREIGECSDDPHEMIDEAVREGGLVLVEHPRAAYWQGQAIEIDWESQAKLWDYFYRLVECAKRRESLDRMKSERDVNPGYLAKVKHRLTKNDGFPISLSDLIKGAGCGTQRLDVSPEKIRIFELETTEILRERTP